MAQNSIIIDRATVLDFLELPTSPGNPPANTIRMYADLVTNKLVGIDSSGTTVFNAGTVSSVAVAPDAGSILTVSGSPITVSGTITLGFAAETGNTVLSSPSGGGSGTPTFRSLVAADIPNLAASIITSGTLALARGGTNADLSGVTANKVIKMNSAHTALTSGILYDDGSEVRVGSTTNISQNASRMYVFGGSNGCNIDIQGDGTSASSDQATVEVEASNYATTTASIYMQFGGPTALGTTSGFSNQNLAILSAGGTNTTNLLIRTAGAFPIVLCPNDVETIRVLSGGGARFKGMTAPGSPASTYVNVYVDSTNLVLSSKNSSGTVSNTVVPDTGASNNFLTAISASGVISKAQPSLSSLSDSSTVATLTGTQTLSNKRYTPRVVALTDATSFTLSADTADVNTMVSTQSTGTTTANAPSGTPVSGQLLLFRIKSTNVQTYSWNAAFRGSTTTALPTATTGASKTDYLGFAYNAADSVWDCIASSAGY